MDVTLNTAAAEGVSAEAASPAVASAPETVAVSQGAEQTDQANPDATPEPYVPNRKFKAYGQEREFDEFVVPALKDKDSEQKLRELYSRAYGFDVLKPKYQKTETDFTALQGQHKEYVNQVTEVLTHAQRGDLTNFFSGVGIPKEQVMQWCLKELKYAQMEPDQKAMIDRQQQAEIRAYQLEKQNQQLMQKSESTEIQARNFELNMALTKPEVDSVVKAYEEKHGDGSFREAVIERGVAAFNLTGQDIPAEQAVMDVIKRIAPFLNQGAQPQMAQGQAQIPQAASPAKQSQTMAKPVPVIPNVSSRNASPTKKAPRSIEDLKKLHQEMAARG